LRHEHHGIHGVKRLLDIMARHKAGEAVGVYSVCSAHPLIIEAALRVAQRDGTAALIEATSNQVNQDGGYTGMRPADFAHLVLEIAARVGLPAARVMLGGDHLGPNCWQQLDAEAAMSRSERLIGDYVAAGFRKIHLDCSMSCAGDPLPLSDERVAARAARLCAIAERTWRQVGGEAPVYIVGTEVPVPGGAHETLTELMPTAAVAVATTIEAHRKAFREAGLNDAWARVVGLVVQPGVEFDHYRVIDFRPERVGGLGAVIEAQPHLLYEAHSTDYQTAANLRALVCAHFAILKVGPALSFALREALFALDQIESELLGPERATGLRSTILAAMQAEPKHWQRYYASSGLQLRLDCQYSLSDRIRYYWPQPSVVAALEKLMANLDATPPPLALLSQYLPAGYRAVREGQLALSARELAMHHVAQVLQQYASACGHSGGGSHDVPAT
jgi:D-tagatose-1,6-bisphosphate aldolase subunit GatZ/KbaZ